ncbi:MAG: acyl--CoA ligase [Candidatus Nomurabacteria bacterium]|jgi:long-chain acyl-CoA synthetase|nr:acyl--CoA ligase [Candidatus Nomurabacteria bacterium]
MANKPNRGELKAPWLSSYGSRKQQLEYYDISMYELLKRKATNFMNYVAYDYFGTEVTFRQFIGDIDHAAQALMAFRVKRGDYVTIVSANIPEAVGLIYAINKIGAVANIVHPLSSEADIKRALTLTKSKLLFVMDMAHATAANVLLDTNIEDVVVLSAKDSMMPLMQLGYVLTQGRKVGRIRKAPRLYSWQEFIENARHLPEARSAKTRASDPAVVLYSGGTTGTPKGVLVSNGAFNAHVVQCPEFAPEIQRGKSVLGILPIFHGFGLSFGFHVGLCNGVTNIMLPRFDGRNFHKVLQSRKPNIILGVPTLFEAMLQNKHIAKMDLSFLELLICGGDTLPNQLKDECDKMFASCGCMVEVLRGYGLTEYLAGAAFTPKENPKRGCVGIPIADVYMKIVKPGTDNELLAGEIGEIVVCGPSMMTKYLDNEEETSSTLVKHSDGHTWLHTGDLGRLDEDGFLFFEQRLKRLIISSGYNVYPNHIEDVILDLDEVATVAVVGVPHRYKGEVVEAYVVLRKDAAVSGDTKKKIMEHCRAKLPRYSWPREVKIIDSMPKTKLGKVAYTELGKYATIS